MAIICDVRGRSVDLRHCLGGGSFPVVLGVVMNDKACLNSDLAEDPFLKSALSIERRYFKL